MAGKNNGGQLAKFWVELARVKTDIDNTLIPLAAHLGITSDDPQLDEALEQLSQSAADYFEAFSLVSQRKGGGRPD